MVLILMQFVMHAVIQALPRLCGMHFIYTCFLVFICSAMGISFSVAIFLLLKSIPELLSESALATAIIALIVLFLSIMDVIFLLGAVDAIIQFRNILFR